MDILYTNGDAFDYIPPGPRPWHGVQWLENKGNLKNIYLYSLFDSYCKYALGDNMEM